MVEPFERRVELSCSVDTAWAWVSNFQAIANSISVVDSVGEVEPWVTYGAVLADRVGPFRLRADLVVTVEEMVAPKRMTLRASGEDRQVGSRLEVKGSLEVEGSTTGSVVLLRGTYEITGTVATLGASTIRKKTGVMLEEFENGLLQGTIGAR